MVSEERTYGERAYARLAAIAPFAFIFALIDALVIRASANASLLALALLWLYQFWMYALACAVCALLASGLLGDREKLPAYGVAAGFATCWGVANYLFVWLASGTFANKELSALLVTVLSLGVVVVLSRAHARWSEQMASSKPALFGAVALTVIGWGGLLWHNRAGFGQLDPWTSILPSSVLITSFVSSVWIAPRLTARPAAWLARVGIVGTLTSVVAFLAIEISGATTSSDAARFGPVTRYVAATVQRFTDFDGDGHSSLMGGADCAAFDASISPGAREIPGDGIDNNCIGGDEKSITERRAPTYQKLPEGWREGMNVVVISVEALRPDHIHALGYERETTPNIDRLIEESVVFERFYASSTFTRLSLPSLWSTASPSKIAWQGQEKTKMPMVAPTNAWIPTDFEQAGYTTLAIHTNFPAFTSKDNIGFDRGFTRYNHNFRLPYRGGTMRGFPSIAQTDRALRLFGEFQKKKKPFLLWLHMVEPHYMYEQFPGAPVFGEDRIARYDSEIWGVDQQIGRIITDLKKRGMWENTILFITGDHGEEFEEHGERYHGSNLYEQQIRTLGLLRAPGLKAQRIESPVGFVDVGATLLNMAGVDAKESYARLSGRNMTRALIEEQPLEKDTVISEVWDVLSQRGYQIATISWPYKLILSGKNAERRELYDLSRDPAEASDLWEDPKHRDVREAMLEEAMGYLDGSDRTYRMDKGAKKP